VTQVLIRFTSMRAARVFAESMSTEHGIDEAPVLEYGAAGWIAEVAQSCVFKSCQKRDFTLEVTE